ncbi:MAG: glutamate-1-semialdehyde 2,1-aminomutase [Pseudobdellovibrionaceae bacterium]
MQSGELFERAKKVTPGGVHSPVRSFKGLDQAPVFFKKAQGAYLTSVEDKTYIDFCQSFGPLVLGHRDADVAEEVHRMIDTAWTFGACEIYSLELAEWMTQHLPWVEKLRFVSSGTEAVMSALRVARAATHRTKILKFEGCYHGHADQLLVKAGSGLAGTAASSSAGISPEVAATTLVTPLNDIEKLREVFSLQGKEIAAVIIEPLPANYGLLVQKSEFLHEVKNLCQANGALLIFDEVISGFRTALGGMVEVTGLKPDLVTYGKVIGGGFPVGCYGGRRDLMDLVAPSGDVYQAGTLSANPVGMRAGLRTLQKMKALDGWKVLNQRTLQFCQKLQKGLAEIKAPVQVSHYSSLFWIHGCVQEPIRRIEQIPPGQGENFKKLFLKCLEKGVYLAPNAYEVGFLSLAHTEDILDEAAGKILQAAREVFS